LDAAVARMTEAALSEGRESLVMTTDQWKKLILSGVRGGVRQFGMEMVNSATNGKSIEVANRWLSLAMDIWNAMPETVRRHDLQKHGTAHVER